MFPPYPYSGKAVKPENCVFQSDQEDAINLINFGFSRRLEMGEESMSNPVGTPQYMSLELLKGKYDRSCDIWSVGVVAYMRLPAFRW